MKLQLAVLFSVILIASAVRERVVYEAFSGLDCQDADLGSITVRFEDSTDPRFDCTNYATTSYRSTANGPLPDPIADFAYVAVQHSTCQITDQMEYWIYSGKPSTDCWNYHNFSVFVNGVNEMISVNLQDTLCKSVDYVNDYKTGFAITVCSQRLSNYSTSAAYGAYPVKFTPVPVAPPTDATPVGTGSPSSVQTPSSTPSKPSTPGTTKTSSGVVATSVGFLALSSLLALYL